jgi:putative ABC transport system permease protein
MPASFAVRLAWRETRAGWRHFAALVLCVALGVAALVGVAGFGAALDRALAREGKRLMGGDLELRAPRPLDAGAAARLAALVPDGTALTHVRELAGMARDPRGGATVLVELKAVETGWPLYGSVETRPDAPLSSLLEGDGALVEDGLLARLGLRVGDPLVVGVARLIVRGVVVREPDRIGLVALGPRVLVSAATLDRSGLLQLGSRVRYRTLVRLPDGAAVREARDALARDLADPGIRVAAYDDGQPGLRRFFDQLTTYLGLVGLASLLVGAIGVASSVRAFIRRRRDTLAVLKCLGAPSRVLVAAYLAQALVLGLAGSALGAALGVAAQPLLARVLAGLAPIALDGGIDAWSVGRGMLMGVLMTALAALPPLLAIRAVPPALVLRQDVDRRTGRGRWPWLAALVPAAGLGALAVWQAGSLKLGAIFLGASLAALVALALIARVVALASRALPRLPSLAWRQGLANLARPGGHAAGVVVALGVGVMLLVAVAVLESALARQLDHERRREAPSFFFVDLQPDQTARFVELVRATGATTPALTPVVRARLAAVDGEPVTRESVARRRRDGRRSTAFFTRDYVLTAAATPPPGNVVVRGRWWSAGAPGPAQASVEEAAAKSLGVGPGSTLVFDVQGVPLAAEVTSVRKVDWQTLSTNFFVILSPGALDGAPTTYVATARVPAAREAAVQDAVVAAFPNVTAVPVRDVLERVAAVLDRIGVAIRAVALFAIASGLVVMVGALTASRYQRLTESVILRTLGATRGAVARIFAVEYACLGAAAGAGGAALASLLAWVVLRFVLDVPWSLDPLVLALGVALAAATAVAVGFLATFRLLGQKPLPVLRRE